MAQMRQALGSTFLKWPGGISRPWKEDKGSRVEWLTANGKEARLYSRRARSQCRLCKWTERDRVHVWREMRGRLKRMRKESTC